MLKENDFSRLELKLSACRDNYRYFRSLLEPSTKLLVLVKANAYGHGAVEFASMMQREGADYLAVAYPIEGIELRKSGISLPILVLTAGTDYYNEIIDSRLSHYPLYLSQQPVELLWFFLEQSQSLDVLE